MPTPGEIIDPPPEVREKLLRLGVAAEFELKVQPVPEEVKKNGLSE